MFNPNLTKEGLYIQDWLQPGDYTITNRSTGKTAHFHLTGFGTVESIVIDPQLPPNKPTLEPQPALIPPSQQPGLSGFLRRVGGIYSPTSNQINAQNDAMWYNTQVLRNNVQNGQQSQPIPIPNVQPNNGGYVLNNNR